MKKLRNLIFKLKNKMTEKNNIAQDKELLISNVRTKIGKYTYGYESTAILSWENSDEIRVEIGRFCSISYGLKIYTGGGHNYDWMSTYPFGHVGNSIRNIKPVSGHPKKGKAVKIGHDVWIGRDVTIMSGVKIGNGAVIAANSHVVKDVEAFSLVGGNPAQLIRYRFDAKTIKEIERMSWWNWPDEKIFASIDKLCAPPQKNSEAI